MSEVVVYQPDEKTRLETRVEDDTVWLSQKHMCALFGVTQSTISEHIKNALAEELEGISTYRDFRYVASDGKNRTIKCYNLDVILSVGYRVKSPRGVQFRRWANGVLKDRILNNSAIVTELRELRARMDALTVKVDSANAARLTSKTAPYALDAERNCRAMEAIRENISRLAGPCDALLVFVRSEIVNRWVKPFGMTIEDVRNLAACGIYTEFIPHIRRFPASSHSPERASGIMFKGRDAKLGGCAEIPVIGSDPNAAAVVAHRQPCWA